MYLEKIRIRLSSKPLLYVVISIVYLFLLIVLRWKLLFPVQSLLFFVGGILGIFILDIAESILGEQQSPFRTMVFAIALGICGIYIITSATEVIAKGLVLSSTLSLLFYLLDDYKKMQNFSTWYGFIFGIVPVNLQLIGVLGFVFLFITESIIFVF